MTAALTVSLVLAATSAAPDKAREVKASVEKGLAWLVKQQKDDGSWSGLNDSQPTTTTSFVGLALLMEGSTLQTGEYASNLHKAVEWFEKHAADTGLLGNAHPTESIRLVTSHAHALLFLACAYDADEDPDHRARLRAVVEKAIKYAEGAQLANGGWPQTGRAGAREDTATTVDVLRALLTARRVGFTAQDRVIDKALEYLTKSTTAAGSVGRFGAGPNDRFSPAGLTAAAVTAVSLSDGRRPPVFARWVETAAPAGGLTWPPRSTGTAAAAYLHSALFVRGFGERPGADAGRTWGDRRDEVYRTVVAAQGLDGELGGGIPGPAYTTAVALIVLQLDNDHVPAFAH